MSNKIQNNESYIERYLVKVTSIRGIEYFAVKEKTLENMENSSSAMEHIVYENNQKYQDLQFAVENLGIILVEIEKT
jgi:hypothetical protein